MQLCKWLQFYVDASHFRLMQRYMNFQHPNKYTADLCYYGSIQCPGCVSCPQAALSNRRGRRYTRIQKLQSWLRGYNTLYADARQHTFLLVMGNYECAIVKSVYLFKRLL